MLGPFLPEDHSIVQVGRFKIGNKVLTLKEVYNELWKMALHHTKITKFLIIPSLNDVLSIYPLP